MTEITLEMVTIKVDLPAETVLLLRELAAGVSMTPEQWLASQARGAVLGLAKKRSLVKLYLLGLSDSEIAREMRLTNQQVSTRRRNLGLPANRMLNRSERTSA